jgi:N-acetyl-gamma-glutamyl-phosphate reductase
MKAAILGITGYTGQVLARLLNQHPKIDQIIAVSSSSSGKYIDQLDMGLLGSTTKYNITQGKAVTVDEAAEYNPDIVFSALPHLKSAELWQN